MTDEELDRTEQQMLLVGGAGGQVSELFRLARRGLRAEREVCGTCARMQVEPATRKLPEYLWCNLTREEVTRDSACNCRQAKETNNEM